jgi:4-amino-4-deoxy-L-arabinose transferase-like glycosyltransferase
MKKNLILYLLLFFIFQLCVAHGFELAHDEAYYWLFSRHLDWGYFDHPPFVALIIKIFSFLPHSELSVRLGFIILHVCTILVLLSMVSENKKSLATKLFLSFPLASAIGLFALPDLPLVFMTTIYLWALKRYLEQKNFYSSLIISFSIAGLLYAKYHGIFVIFFTLLAVPKLFREKTFYFVFFLSLLLFMPHLNWQYQHDFSTLRYHFLERPSSDFNFSRLVEFIGSQIFLAGLFVGPFIWWISLRAKVHDQFHRVLKYIALGSLAFFFLSTFNKKFEANWTIYLCSPLVLLVIDDHIWERINVKRMLNASFVIILVSRLILIINPNILNIKRLREFHGWKDFAHQIQSNCESELIANTYQISSKLSFYLEKEVHSLNLGSRKNQFDFWSFDQELNNKKVCFLVKHSSYRGEIIETPDLKNLVFLKNIDYNLLKKEKQNN